ncbi:MAG: hypothetical protein M3082_01070 [Candidatus Dormibacteraeota bacterium]|nr:hypothetical protein [Candidatus Dormibacteraeota bacterium]
MSVDQIDLMPGKRFGRPPAKTRPLNIVGDRIITLRLTGISDFQKRKLRPDDWARLDSGELGAEELLDLGEESFINIVVYGFDRF